MSEGKLSDRKPDKLLPTLSKFVKKRLLMVLCLFNCHITESEPTYQSKTENEEANNGKSINALLFRTLIYKKQYFVHYFEIKDFLMYIDLLYFVCKYLV